MLELGDGLRLTAEALAERLLAAQLGVEGLDRDLPVEGGVVRQIYGRHPAFAEQVTQLVTAAGDRTARVATLRTVSAVLAHDLLPPRRATHANSACHSRDDPYYWPICPRGYDTSSRVPVP